MDIGKSLKGFFAITLCVLTACGTHNQASASNVAAKEAAKGAGSEVVLTTRALRACGIEAASPQIFAFKDARLVSTEYGFSPGQPLNLETSKPGPLANKLDGLGTCVSENGGDFDKWKNCGSQYCVIRLLPAPSLGHCPYCDATQGALDGFFASHNAKVIYSTLRYEE